MEQYSNSNKSGNNSSADEDYSDKDPCYSDDDNNSAKFDKTIRMDQMRNTYQNIPSTNIDTPRP